MSVHSEANRRWENQVKEFQQSISQRELLGIDGETELRHWRSSRRSRKTCKIETLNLKIWRSNHLHVNVQWRRVDKEMKFRTEEVGHSSAWVTNRSGMELLVFHLKKCDSTSTHSKKLVIQYSRVSVFWVVEFWKERIRGTPHTSMRMFRRQNSYFERFTQQISSVSTEQSQSGVNSPVKSRMRKSRPRKGSWQKKMSNYWKKWNRNK